MKLNGITAVPAVLFLVVFTAQAAIDLDVTEHVLPNGMKVLAVERHAVPVVTFKIYYRAGSIDETPGKTGMAHYCEHMMFKSTEHLSGEDYARLMGASGSGHTNANTSFDRTCYHVTVPPDRLELVVRLEAERMANLQPTREEAARELDVVLEELRLNYMDDPMGKLRMQLNATAFEKHPYHTLTIGWYDDVKSFTYEDLMEFHDEFYVPDRAVAVVVGDFDTHYLMTLMNRFFGDIPSGERELRQYTPEPLQLKERRFTLKERVQKPVLSAGYKASAARNPDSLALEVFSVILSHGRSSPLGRLSTGEDMTAMYAYAYFRPLLEPSLVNVFAMPMPDVTIETLEEQVFGIIDNVLRRGISQEELDRAKTQMLSSAVYQMQSSLGIATALGEAEMVSSWQDALNLEDRLRQLTPKEVTRVAKRYLIPERRTVGILEPVEVIVPATPQVGMEN